MAKAAFLKRYPAPGYDFQTAGADGEANTGGRRFEEAILDLGAVSPDGRWIVVLEKEDTDKDHPYRRLAYPIGGGTR